MSKKGAREDEEDLTKITTPIDEFHHWSSMSEQYQLKPVCLYEHFSFFHTL